MHFRVGIQDLPIYGFVGTETETEWGPWNRAAKVNAFFGV